MVFDLILKTLVRTGSALFAGCALLALSGCGSTLPLFSNLIPDHTPFYTSAIRSEATVLSDRLSANDWNEAYGALADALGPDNAGTVVTWEGSSGQAKGSFKAQGSAFIRAGDICRAFAADVKFANEAATGVAGTACRTTAGRWQISDATPQKG